MTEKTIGEKLQALEDFFANNSKVALAFSGGVDSSYLFYAAQKSGCDIHAYFVNTQFQPRFELEDAEKITEGLGAKLKVIEYDILSVPEVASNEKDRCYHCKRAIFGSIIAAAQADGCEVIADGTNASDDAADRPGMRALAEMGIRSPLRECGFTKDEIRALSEKAGLFIWDKPAYACLATRVPTAEHITEEILRSVEKAEDYMMKLGFSDFRVRYFHGAAKIQVKKEQLEKAVCLYSEISSVLSQYFSDVLLDFKTR